MSTMQLLKHSMDEVSADQIKGLFITRRVAYSTSLIIFIYAALGIAYPLFNAFLAQYLATRNASFGDSSVDATYSTYTYQAACGIGGSIFASILVLGKFGGRKIAMAFSTCCYGIFLFALTAARTPAAINGLTQVACSFLLLMLQIDLLHLQFNCGFLR